ncbi:MAG TPA: hypothetical protein VHX60_07210 [Acidobacteriaceae bacterium]|jgi:hypothetical protein|nr:hypothetical protein [Acidobacteriaceae bacterium]
MSLLTLRAAAARTDAAELPIAEPRSLFAHCGNPRCDTGWMQLWRNSRRPLFAGRWACSPRCMEQMVSAALSRESADASPLRPRLPMPTGLILVEHGDISAEQLQAALRERAQSVAEGGQSVTLGEWLVTSGVVRESVLTRALGMQWSCPVFSLSGYRPDGLGPALPQLLGESLAALPVSAAPGKLLYLAFAGCVDRSLSYAVERMLGVRVVPGVAGDGEFRRAQARFRAEPAPPARLLEAAGAGSLARSLARIVEREKPADARLVRVHNTWWLRLWKHAGPVPGTPDFRDVEDILCVAGAAPAPAG